MFWHWQHFFYTGTQRPDLGRDRLPLYDVFFLFYEKGWMAVDLFFALSGFIFFWLYARRIHERQIGATEFALLRISRLYPLHLLTLAVVAVGQWHLANARGSFFVYPLNDMTRFGAHLLFASGWRTAWLDSFNAPAWSVSVEMLLYAAFFVMCWLRLAFSPWALTAAILVGAVAKFYLPVGRGVFSFFVGAVAFHVYARAGRMTDSRRASLRRALAVGVAVGWIACLVALLPGRAGAVLDLSGMVGGRGANLLVTGLLMPASILLLAMLEDVRPGFASGLSALGDASYSSYMLHFPLQLLVVIAAPYLGLSDAAFLHPVTLILFFAVLIVLSVLCFRRFERPVQDAIRRRMPRRRAAG